jgi:polar amino acid transport system ATP-binding protein
MTKGASGLLRIEGATKRFGDHEVLKGIDLDIAEHEVVCLIGASGSGKSTLLRCINGLLPLDEGTIVVDGMTVSQYEIELNVLRREVGIVFQSFNLFPHMTVVKNIALAPRKVLGLSKREANERAHELLERIGLWEKRDDYPDRLSGGQQQRVAIVRALAMRPKLMLLDEITSALDPELVASVLELVRELAGEGMTMMLATHEMSFAREVADRVCFLDAGVIAEMGPPEQMFSAPKNPRTAEFLKRIIAAGRL